MANWNLRGFPPQPNSLPQLGPGPLKPHPRRPDPAPPLGNLSKPSLLQDPGSRPGTQDLPSSHLHPPPPFASSRRPPPHPEWLAGAEIPGRGQPGQLLGSGVMRHGAGTTARLRQLHSGPRALPGGRWRGRRHLRHPPSCRRPEHCGSCSLEGCELRVCAADPMRGFSRLRRALPDR